MYWFCCKRLGIRSFRVLSVAQIFTIPQGNWHGLDSIWFTTNGRLGTPQTDSNPINPTALRLLIMISIEKACKKGRFWGVRSWVAFGSKRFEEQLSLRLSGSFRLRISAAPTGTKPTVRSEIVAAAAPTLPAVDTLISSATFRIH